MLKFSRLTKNVLSIKILTLNYHNIPIYNKNISHIRNTVMALAQPTDPRTRTISERCREIFKCVPLYIVFRC